MKDLGRYFSFSGCSTRSQFWATEILNILISGAVMLACIVIASLLPDSASPVVMIITLIPVIVAYTIVYWATLVRRVRDAGINPWFALCTALPYVGLIAFIVFGCLPTDETK